MPRMKNGKRDYSYDKAYQKKPAQRKNQASRKRARRKAEKLGLVRKGDKKDVHHKDGNPRNNSRKNLKVTPRSKNRSKK